jgi:4-hydroxy-3-polyprenylbenzoate decarboxylase
MGYRNLQDFIQRLRTENELYEVDEPVSPALEMSEIADRLVKNGGKAVLFKNNGTGFPVLMNAFGSHRQVCLALCVDNLEEAGERIDSLFKALSKPNPGLIGKLKLLPFLKKISTWMPHVSRRRGECQEVVMEIPDLSKLPVIKCWPHDGGPFITLPLVHTKDPVTGTRNTGMYRMQVFSPTETGMHWHLHKNSARHYHEYKRLKMRMPVAVALGGDPVYTYAATAPLPDQVDEYMLAGFLRQKSVELVKCRTCDLEVPADADFVIEGYVDPEEELRIEGPFGDHTGYYSLEDLYPVFHVTCITHRRNAVYPATVVGIPPMEDYFLGLATERLFLQPIRMTMLPEIIDMHMPAEGVFHNLVIVKIKKSYPGQAVKVMNALWGAGQMMFNKVMVVVDDESMPAPLTDYPALITVVAREVDPAHDVVISRGPVDVLDHSSHLFAEGGKMGIDATVKYSVLNTEYGIGSTEYGVRIVRTDKTEMGQVRKMAEEMMAAGTPKAVKFLVFVEDHIDPEDFPVIVWRVANNIDPQRDCYLLEDKSREGRSVLVIDGTRKNLKLDGFNRPWPNILCMDDETIRKVDEKWAAMGLGGFLESPSLKYKSQLYPGGARTGD